jgi:hypothetical protein
MTRSLGFAMAATALFILATANTAVVQAFVVVPSSQLLAPHPRTILSRNPKTATTSAASSLMMVKASSKRSEKPEDDTSPLTSSSWKVNPLPAAAWIALVAIAFSSAAPGELGSADDAAMLNQILADPVSPGINELFYTLFNVFLPLPVILAALILPQGSKQGIPAGPFLAGSAFLGYFAIGPYLSLRETPRESIAFTADVSWFTTNITENKVTSWLLLVILLYLPVAADLPAQWATDSTAVWQGFVDILSSSRFAAISCMDLTLLHLVTAALIPADYRLRSEDDSSSVVEATGNKIALAAALFPFVGPALYCALRPQLLVVKNKDNE